MLSNLDRARAYLAQIPAAVSGAGGHKATFRAACLLVKGFALEEAEALQLLLEEYNPRCEPPWEEKDLVHKVKDAAKAKGDVGYMLRRRERRERQGRASTRTATTSCEQPTTEDGRPIIRVGVDTHRVLDDAVAALSRDPDLYARGAALVTLHPASGLVGPSTRELPLVVLRVRHMARVAEWQTMNKDGWERCTPEPSVVAAVHALGAWPGVRELAGIIDTPVFRPDGTVLTIAGYDAATQLFYVPSAEFGDIPDAPTKQEAEHSLATLMNPFSEFPFINTRAKGAYLSVILGRFMRPMFSGAAPGYCFDANNRGAGKGKLIKSAAIITTGGEAATTPFVADEEEWRKKITSVLRTSANICVVDDVPRGKYLGGWNWNSLLTSDVWQDRILGESTIITMRNLTTWVTTGNGMLLLGDMTRRMIHVRLETPHDKPETIEHTITDIEGYVRENRVELVRAALTLIRAWVVAGKPRSGVRLLGSYESWSAHVAAVVAWLGFGDISQTQDEYEERTNVGEGDAATLKPLVNAWEKSIGLNNAVTASHLLMLIVTEDRRVDQAKKLVVRFCDDDEPLDLEHRYKDLREAIIGFAPSKTGGLPSTVYLGRMLSASLKRPINGRWLVSLGKDRNDVTQFGLTPIAGDAGDAKHHPPHHPPHTKAYENRPIVRDAGDAGDDLDPPRKSDDFITSWLGSVAENDATVAHPEEANHPPHPPQNDESAVKDAGNDAGDALVSSPAHPPHPPQDDEPLDPLDVKAYFDARLGGHIDEDALPADLRLEPGVYPAAVRSRLDDERLMVTYTGRHGEGAQVVHLRRVELADQAQEMARATAGHTWLIIRDDRQPVLWPMQWPLAEAGSLLPASFRAA